MVLLLHGAIRFFVISCSANIYKTFLNWRILKMSNDGKQHFHLKEYSILQLLYMHSCLSYSESDILSVTHVLGYNIVRFGSVLHTLLKMKNKGIFFFYCKKNH